MIDEEAELDRLYAAPLDQFVTVRNDLARRFRQEGERAVATRVGELKKPTLPVWVVNQLAKREPRVLKELVEAGTEMRSAQERSASGDLQAAIERHREALRKLVGRAEEALGEAGRSATGDTVDRVWSTLRAASIDPEMQESLLAGRLDREVETSGFPAGLTFQPASPAAGTRAKKSDQRGRREAAQAARKELKEREKAVQEARKRVRDAEAEERRARQALERAESAADKARGALAEAEESLADARARGDAARA